MTIEVKFRGIDDWNRPVFKCVDEKYRSLHFGDVNKLWEYNDDPKMITDYYKEFSHHLEYFGIKFGCEPHGGMPFTGLKLKVI